MRLINLVRAKEAAEAALGIEIDESTAAKVLKYAAQKCIAIGKDTDYLETLYENELCDHYTRMAISMCSMNGGIAHV